MVWHYLLVEHHIFDDCISIVPERPIERFTYSCGTKFNVEPMLEYMTKRDKKDDWIVVEIDGHVTTILEAFLERDYIKQKPVKTIRARIPKRTRRGGQSSCRIDRNRDILEAAYLKSVREWLLKTYMLKGCPTVQGLVVTGNGPMKHQMKELKPFITTNHLSLNLFQQCPEFKQFIDLFRQASGKIVYGKSETVEALNHSQLKYFFSTKPTKYDGSATVFSCSHVLLEQIGGYAGIKWY